MSWRERNDPAFIRSRILERDKGICALCGCDADKEFAAVKEQHQEARRLLSWLENRANEELRKQHGWKVRHNEILPMLWPEAVLKTSQGHPYMDFDKLHRLREKELRHWCTEALTAGWSLHRHEGWDVDHIVPVIEGGGQCGLEGLRTLCHPCHKAVTRELAAKRASQRRSAG